MTTVTDEDIRALRDALGPLKDREQVAVRLLEASAKHSFDPDTELDWDTGAEDGKWFWPPELVSLYDTPLWRKMSEEQRMDLARHEAASLASLGIWFEIILMQLLVRHIYDKSVTSKHVRYALTEIADECRHSMMFARMIEWGGAPAYPVPRRYHNLARVLKTISTTPVRSPRPCSARRSWTGCSGSPSPTSASSRSCAASPASTWWRRPGMCATPARSCAARW